MHIRLVIPATPPVGTQRICTDGSSPYCEDATAIGAHQYQADNGSSTITCAVTDKGTRFCPGFVIRIIY